MGNEITEKLREIKLYRCFCNIFPAKISAYNVCVLQFAFSIAIVVLAFLAQVHLGASVTQALWCAVFLASTCMLFFGVFKEKQLFLLIHMIFQVISLLDICLLLVAAILKDRSQAAEGDTIASRSKPDLLQSLIIVCAAYLGLQVWFIFVVLRCRQYISEKQKLIKAAAECL